MRLGAAGPGADPLWWVGEVELHVGREEWDQALACVEEAAAAVDDAWMASYVADALVRSAANRGERLVELAARRLGWRFRPTLRRLAGWLQAAGKDWSTVAETARRDSDKGLVDVPQSHLTRLELLCGDLDAPLARVRFADPTGWWLQAHPAPIVVPVLLWLGARGRSNGQLALALRRSGGTLGAAGWTDWLDEVRVRQAVWQVDGPALLDVGLAEIERLIDAVVEDDARGEYKTVARLAAAARDACRLAARSEAWWDGARVRHPRRRALVAAFDEAARAW